MLHFPGMMSVMMLMFFLVFAAIFGFIIYAFTHASKQNQQNRNAPRLTANAKQHLNSRAATASSWSCPVNCSGCSQKAIPVC